MKKYLILLLVAAYSSGLCQAGRIYATNYEQVSRQQLPISTLSGDPILFGGVVQLGTFSTADPGALIAGLNSPAGMVALLSDFISFGSSISIGTQLLGLYSSTQMETIMEDSILVGKSIYTLIGNRDTLARSTDLRIVRHFDVFVADGPPQLASISAPSSVVVYGDASRPGFTTALGLSANSLGPPIPEPYTVALILSGLGMCLRRKKG